MTDDLYQRGLERVQELDGKAAVDWAKELAKIHPDVARLTVAYPYGALWSRPQLSDRDRAVAVIAALTAQGGLEKELASHVTMSRKNGLSREDIAEVILLMTAYVGFPKALHALEVATAAQDTGALDETGSLKETGA